MRYSVRIFVILLLAIFTMGVVAQTASAAAMSVKMGLADAGNMNMDDCQDCPDVAEGNSSCASFCAMPLIILPEWRQIPAAFAHDISATRLARNLIGRSGSPDPYPPRSLILS